MLSERENQLTQLSKDLSRSSVPAGQLLATLEKVRDIGHWHIDLRTKYVSWSDRAAELHLEEAGFSPKNFKSALAYYRKCDRAKLRAAIEAAIKEQKTFSCVVRMHKSADKTRYVRVSGEVGAVDGQITEIWGFIEDISKEENTRLQKNRAQAIERKLRTAIDEMNVGFILFDSHNRLIWCNETYKKFYPKSKPAMTAGTTFKRILEYGLAQGEYSHAIGQEENWKTQRLESLNAESGAPLEVLLSDGRWVLVHDAKMPKGGWAGFRVDITELKSLQKKLSSALFEARTAGQVQAALLPNLVHELKTPLNAVVGFAQLVGKLGEGSANSAKIVEYASDIEHSGLHMVSLIESLLSTPSVDEGSEETLKSVMLSEVLDRANHVAADLALRKGKALKFVRPESAISVKAHQTKLVQVLINLLSNALKYSPREGTVEVRVDTSDEVDLKIWVIDDGEGIEPEAMHRIFNRYDRLSADRRGDDGIGIGLAIAKDLVEAMGGRIGVENVPGRGAGFWVSLQRCESRVVPNTSWCQKRLDSGVIKRRAAG